MAERGPILSKRLKARGNYRKGGNTGFETAITRLQTRGYVCVSDFVYQQDKFGRPYGWGVAQYATPEALFGADFATSAYCRTPEESLRRMLRHLRSILPETSEWELLALLQG